jgi:hypothetical protein
MKSALLASTVVAVLTSASMAAAHAMIIRPTIVTSPDVIRPHWVRAGMRYAAGHSHVRIFDRRKLGMHCVMPPDMQVVLDWPGPACAYTDNFIFMPHRHRHHIR